MEGFGQWEFLNLLGVSVSGGAEDVHLTFMEKWDFENDYTKYRIDAKAAEVRRMGWREYRRHASAFLTLWAQSGLTKLLDLPTQRGPRDLERFFEET